jgi:16S rRNA C967 or C1407 C5-methylase (RsmB/RsmF family)/NOL1/NOP2/fmu family ribosome biogenesis protein
MPNVPQQLLNSLNELGDFDQAAFVEAHAEENKITSIRLNPFKKTKLDFEPGDAVPWNSEGFYLKSRPSFTLDPLFHAGCYYVQEAGSMFLELALKQSLDFSESLKVLDACASPGGKSTLINSLLNQESLLVANEIIKSRADILSQNLSKWGTSNTIVTNNEPQRFGELPSFFDAIVIDAPCSGSGLFRKQPEAINEWSMDHVKSCSIRQNKILADVIPSLKEGGILVYSTCSYSKEENEDIVRRLIEEYDMEYIRLEIFEDWGIVETESGYRFYPHLTKSEGFFCAVLRKKSSSGSTHFSKKKGPEISRKEQEIFAPFITDMAKSIVNKNNRYHLLNQAAADFLNVFEKQFYFKKAGTVLGEIKGNDMVPNQELAWSLTVNRRLNSVELDKENSLKFLRKENFFGAENSKGLVLLTYKNYGLGWAKILQNRINNYLPNELRILK